MRKLARSHSTTELLPLSLTIVKRGWGSGKFRSALALRNPTSEIPTSVNFGQKWGTLIQSPLGRTKASVPTQSSGFQADLADAAH